MTLFAFYVDSSTNTNCVISFYNGTELLGSENVRLGTAYLTQATVNREGYEFIGWDYNGDNTSDEFPIIITGNLSLYACYKKIEIEVIEHTISYYFDGELLGTKKYVEGKAYTPDSYQPSADYDFIGWDMNGDNIPDELPEIIKSDLKLSACVKLKDQKALVSFFDGELKIGERVFNIGDDLLVVEGSKTGFIFVGWDIDGDGLPNILPEKVNGNISLYACFLADTVSKECKIEYYDGEELLGEITYELGQVLKLTGATKKGYDFLGWDANGDGTPDEFPEIILQNYVLKACFADAGHNIYFINDSEILYQYFSGIGVNVEFRPNEDYDDKEFTYVFKGWDANEDGNIENFPYLPTEDTVFKAVFEQVAKKFTYKLYANNELIAESSTCLYKDEIEYPEVKPFEKDNILYVFMGWDYDNDQKVDKTIREITSDVNANAVYTTDQYILFNYDGEKNAYYYPEGVLFTLYEKEISVGYELIWYLDSECTKELNIHKMPKGILELFGKLEEIRTVDPSILTYDPSVETISSYNELGLLFNSLLLNKITNKTVKVEFEIADYNDILDFIKNNIVIRRPYELNFSALGQDITFDIKFVDANTISTNEYTYSMLPSANIQELATKRAENAALPIDSVVSTYKAIDSESLFYILERGYKPEIEDQELLKLYNKMRKVLIDNVTDDMTDLQKARAIYEYLVMNIIYDKEVLKKASAGEANMNLYHSFYLEGVFNDKLAVCDGLSKAYVSLLNMEGISCVRVTGESVKDQISHAWCKVCIDNKWYIVDPTNGGMQVGKVGMLTYNFFMISESKYSAYYTDDKTSYADFKCYTDYDVYSTLKVTINNVEYSLSVNDIDEAGRLVRWLIDNNKLNSSFDLKINFESNKDNDVITKIINASGMTPNLSYQFVDDSLVLVLEEVHVLATYFDGNDTVYQKLSNVGDALESFNNPKIGYVFIGWDINKDNFPDVLPEKIYENTSLYACYVEASLGDNCKISYYSGNTLLREDNHLRGRMFNAITDVNRDGCNFIGWDIDGDDVPDKMPEIVVYDLKLYACFASKDGYARVRYYDNGTLLEDSIYLIGSSFIARAGDAKDGYVFIGWDVTGDNSPDLLSTSVQGDMKLNAYYVLTTDDMQCTVKYYDGETLSIEKNYSLGQLFTPEKLTKDGYTFLGWDMNNDGIVDELPDLIVTDLTLKACFKQNE